MELIHYGSDSYNPLKFKKIKNVEYFNKPYGGLWTSPVNSNHSWKDWCIAEDFRVNSLNKSFQLVLNKDARIATIQYKLDLFNLPLIKNKMLSSTFMQLQLDYKEISKEFDAIHLTAEGERNTRFSMEISLYGWDCESVLILNKNCFTII